MGQVIILSERRASRDRSRPLRQPDGQPKDRAHRSRNDHRRPGASSLRPAPSQGRPAFFFDLGCPFSYLEADGIERTLGEVDWVPVSSAALTEDSVAAGPPSGGAPSAKRRGSGLSRAIRRAAEQRATELRLPLVWPEHPSPSPLAPLRAAVFAAEHGAASRFALAAGRLVYCGGFDLGDPEVLAEAAAAAGLPLRQTLAAARDSSRDLALHSAARSLTTRGIDQVPVVAAGGTWHHGCGAVRRAGELLRWRTATGSSLAPAG